MMKRAHEDLRPLCAPGSNVREWMLDVQVGVSLRIIEFTPPVKSSTPPVVFVSGWITQVAAWKIVLQEMTRDFKVYYIETREKISSDVRIKADYSVEEIGSDLARVVERLNLPPGGYIFFGSSLGASAIVESYHLLKSRPMALMLIGPNAVFRVPVTWKIIVKCFYPPLYALVKPPAKWYLKTFRLNVQADIEQYVKYCAAIDGADPWKLRKAVLAAAKYSIWNRLTSLDCPVLLVDASKDHLHEPENLRRISTMIPHGTCIDLETNKGTHSEKVVEEFRGFVHKLLQG